MITSTESHLLYLKSFLPLSSLDNQVILAKGRGGKRNKLWSFRIFYFSRLLVNDTRQMEVFYEFMSFLLGNCCSYQSRFSWIMCEFRGNVYYFFFFFRIMLGLFKIYPEEKHLRIESLKWIKETDSNLQFNLLISLLS